MERMKKPCLGVTLLLFLLLVSAAHGAQLADAKDVAELWRKGIYGISCNMIG
ncbi:unnamed protein product [Miscanthus lutarioriparius]|uniref:Uncharacterized protein n=1 Tax=Miscanthus lutarioriparius TaxID=422564 RepID=A0A811N3V3_9POAL|nr:unnamed protein product [Miscanthus lutarioriparius]